VQQLLYVSILSEQGVGHLLQDAHAAVASSEQLYRAVHDLGCWRVLPWSYESSRSLLAWLSGRVASTQPLSQCQPQWAGLQSVWWVCAACMCLLASSAESAAGMLAAAVGHQLHHYLAASGTDVRVRRQRHAPPAAPWFCPVSHHLTPMVAAWSGPQDNRLLWMLIPGVLAPPSYACLSCIPLGAACFPSTSSSGIHVGQTGGCLPPCIRHQSIASCWGFWGLALGVSCGPALAVPERWWCVCLPCNCTRGALPQAKHSACRHSVTGKGVHAAAVFAACGVGQPWHEGWLMASFCLKMGCCQVQQPQVLHTATFCLAMQ
jgi:hypothetical protein